MLKTLSAAAISIPFACLLPSCGPRSADQPLGAVDAVRIQLPAHTPRPPFHFSAPDGALLDEIEHGAFNYLWSHVSPGTGMVYDRTNSSAISIGGVGFQLSAIPVGVERGWITKDQGNQRVLQILRALEGNPRNRVEGMFFHFLDENDAGPTHEGYEHIVSTVDSALFFAGAITAGEYFGAEARDIAQRLVAGANWRFYLAPGSAAPHERGFLSLGWKATGETPSGFTGELLPYYWLDAGDEQLLTTFLAVASPAEEHRADSALYFRLRRRLGRHDDIGPFVWFPWSGSMFTSVFAHLWVDYGRLGLDNPAAQGVHHRPRVDWWANSAMVVQMQRAKAIENPNHLPTLGPDAWGLTSCDYPDGYLVPSLFPQDVPMPGAEPELDYSTYQPTEKWGDGTLATYGAAMALLFDPAHALRALRNYRELAQNPALGSLWNDPRAGGWGFADSFKMDAGGEGGTPAWVSPLHFAIDTGPMVLAIENARTGLVWRLFHANPAVRAGLRRLGL